MPVVSSLICRSLLAGDSERPLTDYTLNRLQAGSYNSTKPEQPLLRGIGPIANERITENMADPLLFPLSRAAETGGGRG